MSDLTRFGGNLDDFFQADHSVIKAEMEADKKAEKNREGGGGGFSSGPPIRWLTIHDGDRLILRFFPHWTIEGEHAHMPHIKIFQHWNVGPEENRRVICPEKVGKGSCYICEEVKELYSQLNELVGYTKLPDDITGDITADNGEVIPMAKALEAQKIQRKVRKIAAKKGYIYQCFDRDDPFYSSYDDEVKDGYAEEGDIKIYFLRVNQTTHGYIRDYTSDPRYGQIWHPMKGYDFEIDRKGSGFDTKYGVKIATVVDPESGDLVMKKTPMFAADDGTPDVEKIHDALSTYHELDKHPYLRLNHYEEGKALADGMDPREARQFAPDYEPYRSGGSNNGTNGASTPSAPASSTPSTPSGSSASPANTGDQLLEDWRANTKGGEILTQEQLADWGGWELDDVKEMTCYTNEPNHEDDDCWKCEARHHCVASFLAKNGKVSISEPDPPKKSVGKKGIGKKKPGKKSKSTGSDEFAKAISEESDDVAAMTALLEGAAQG